METLFRTSREPKTVELENTDDDRLRLLITLKTLGIVPMLEYFLDEKEAQQLSAALQKKHEPK